MPQIEQLAATYASQIFWLLIFFGLVYFVIGRAMVPKVTATVDARDQQISKDLAAAEAARAAADREEDAWRAESNRRREEAQALVNAAKNKAGRHAEQRLAAASNRIDAQLAEAEGRITASRRAALAEIEQVASEAMQDIVQRVAGLSIDPATARGAVKEEMAHG